MSYRLPRVLQTHGDSAERTTLRRSLGLASDGRDVDESWTLCKAGEDHR